MGKLKYRAPKMTPDQIFEEIRKIVSLGNNQFLTFVSEEQNYTVTMYEENVLSPIQTSE